jgi:hypothetical protein
MQSPASAFRRPCGVTIRSFCRLKGAQVKKTNLTSVSQLERELSSIDVHALLMERAKTAVLSTAIALMEQDMEKLCGVRFARKDDQLCHRGWRLVLAHWLKSLLVLANWKGVHPMQCLNRKRKTLILSLLTLLGAVSSAASPSTDT